MAVKKKVAAVDPKIKLAAIKRRWFGIIKNNRAEIKKNEFQLMPIGTVTKEAEWLIAQLELHLGAVEIEEDPEEEDGVEEEAGTDLEPVEA